MKEVTTILQADMDEDCYFVTNPANKHLIENVALSLSFREEQFTKLKNPFTYGIEIKFDSHVPATKPTGKLIWQEDPFITYEDKDREWGLKLGFCKEETEPVFYKVTKSPFRMLFDFMPVIQPRFVMKNLL